MPKTQQGDAQNPDEELYTLAKAFFNFAPLGDGTKIEIVLPNPERKRTPSLKCNNYPPFDHEVSPDDMYSVVRVHSLLTRCYGEVVELSFVRDHKDNFKNHLVLIGAPYTNKLTEEANRCIKEAGGFHFVGSHPCRAIVRDKSDARYEIKLEDADNNVHVLPESGSLSGVEEMFLVEDYCYVSRRRLGEHVEIIIAGLRAYGQKAAYDFLGDKGFYKQTESVCGSKQFQVVVRVRVAGKSLYGPPEVAGMWPAPGRMDAPLSQRLDEVLAQCRQALEQLFVKRRESSEQGTTKPPTQEEVYKEWERMRGGPAEQKEYGRRMRSWTRKLREALRRKGRTWRLLLRDLK